MAVPSFPCDEGGSGCRGHPGVGLTVGDAERSRHLRRRQAAPDLEFHAMSKRMDARLVFRKGSSATVEDQGGFGILQSHPVGILSPF